MAGGRAHVPQRARRPAPRFYAALPHANTRGIVRRTVGAFVPPERIVITVQLFSYPPRPPL